MKGLIPFNPFTIVRYDTSRRLFASLTSLPRGSRRGPVGCTWQSFASRFVLATAIRQPLLIEESSLLVKTRAPVMDYLLKSAHLPRVLFTHNFQTRTQRLRGFFPTHKASAGHKELGAEPLSQRLHTTVVIHIQPVRKGSIEGIDSLQSLHHSSI